MLLRKVVNLLENRDRILMKLHDEENHRDRKKTYRKIADRY